jgi:hypothetical protein
VPMLTCGLVRSNLALATGFLSSCGSQSYASLGVRAVLAGRGLDPRPTGGYSPVALAMISLATLAGTSAYESNTMV